MENKRPVSALHALDSRTVNSSSHSRKRLCHDNNQKAAEGKTDNAHIMVKLENTKSMLPILPSSDIITIYEKYDLTLIVGSQIHPKGLKAFRISSAFFSMAGDSFNNILKQSESSEVQIAFPEDSPDAFLIILCIIHWRDLPNTLTKDQILDLALVCDKYAIYDKIMMAVSSKNWFAAHSKGSSLLPMNGDIQDWILIAHCFRLHEDYKYLVNSLSMSLFLHQGQTMLLYFYNKDQKETLRKGLPDVIIGKLPTFYIFNV